MEQQITQLIEAIGTIIITVLGGFITAKLKSYATTSSRQKTISTIVTLANDAVVSVEKSGILKNLTSNQKYNSAISEVQIGLSKIGLKPVDEELIANAIERAYSQQAEQLHTVYAKQSEVAAAENKEKVVNDATQKLEDAQARLAILQAEVAEKQQAVDAVNTLSSQEQTGEK